jgi:hypothetical protein
MTSRVLSLEYSQLKSQINNPLDKEDTQVNQHIYSSLPISYSRMIFPMPLVTFPFFQKNN